MTRDMFMIQVLHLNEAIGRLIDLAVFKVPQENKEELFKFLTTNLPAKSDIVMQDGFIALSAERKALLESSIEKMVPVKLSTRDKINARGKIPKGKPLSSKRGTLIKLNNEAEAAEDKFVEKRSRIVAGNNLHSLRKKANLTQAQLSLMLSNLKIESLPHITSRDISRLERGEVLTKISTSKLISIVRDIAQ